MGGGEGVSFTTRKRWNHREEARPAPTPTPFTRDIQANRKTGWAWGKAPLSAPAPPPQHQLARQPHFKPCAHRDQDVGTLEWTSPDADNSATPVPGLRSHKPNPPCGLGPSQAPTPQLTGPQLPCCIRLPSACTHSRAHYTTVVRAPGTHTPRVACAAHRGNRSLAQRAQAPLHSLLAWRTAGEVGRAPGQDPGFGRLYHWLIVKPQEAVAPLRACFPT